MEINDEKTEEMIVNFGSFGYPPQKMANILGVTIGEIEAQMADPDSAFSKLYTKGGDIADYLLDVKLSEMARAGDIKAMKEQEIRKKKQARADRLRE